MKSGLPFAPAVAEWFAETFAAPTRAQRLGWAAIARGEHALLFAPTGSGKTLAAFLAAIDRLMFSPGARQGASAAASSTSRRSRRSPSTSSATCARRSPASPASPAAAARASTLPEVGVRTGDTPPAERAAMLRRAARHPDHDARVALPAAHVARARDRSPAVETVIVDEIHALVGTKRGAHLALSLERLRRARPAGRSSASASRRRSARSRRSRASSAAARALRAWKPRPVDDRRRRRAARRFDLRVEVPVEDMARLGELPPPAASPTAGHAGGAGEPPATLDLAGDPPAPRRAHPRAPLDDDLRQQPPPRRAARGRAQRARPARSSRSRTTARSRASSGVAIEDALKARPAAARSSPRRRSSSASTWARSIW